MKSIWPTLFLCLFTLASSQGQSLKRSIALLDFSQRNGESNSSRIFSAEHMLRVAGMPFEIVTDPISAMDHAVLFCGSQLLPNSLTQEEKNILSNYVAEGGVIIAPRVLDEQLFHLFGIAAFADSQNNTRINWSNNLQNQLFRWINEPEEWSISLGDDSLKDIFKTISYELTTALALGHYSNGSVAVAENSFGKGSAYAFGVSWRDAILRSQINRDFEAQRIASNGFEPTQDVLILLVRSITNKHMPYATWKHTSPENSTSTLMITHDIDASTGLDTSRIFSQSEKALDISATYHITVRYFSDAIITDFYNRSEEEISAIIRDGHVIASHSVGHFPDFADPEAFPIGSPDNLRSNYQPFNNGFKTTGGTVFGECQVSKDILEQDFELQIKAFRSGHLAYNDFLVDVLDSLGYLYNSSYSASDVLTHFPFQNVKGRTFSGRRSNVYEIPVTISDVFHDDPINSDNYLEKADLWLEVLQKVNDNNAPSILLIHPNRTFKLEGQEYFIGKLPMGVHICEMTAFADYWRGRDDFKFETQLIDQVLQITISDESLLIKSISLIINNGQDLDEVVLQDENANRLEYKIEDWQENDLIVYRPDIILDVTPATTTILSPKVYPNPVRDHLYIELELKNSSDVKVEILDLMGFSIYKSEKFSYDSGFQAITINIPSTKRSPGVHICRILLGNNKTYLRKIFLE